MIQEREIGFFPKGGHTHNGQNSTIVELQPGQVELIHLSEALKDWIRSLMGGTGSATATPSTFAPDVDFTTAIVVAGGNLTGTANWINAAFVRFVRVIQSADTTCTLTFYHKNTYAEEDREFKVEDASNYFLTELVWCHLDESNSEQLFWKVENTGSQNAKFKIELKGITIA